MSVFDIDIHRNQEWLRRRKLRLEQVRRQSNEIARALRQKVINEEKARLNKYDRMSETRFYDWKAEKLEELERKFKYALEEFGKGYKLAEAEPDPEEIIEKKYKVNFAKAQIRGEIAQQEELRRKKIAEEQKMSLIERKKLVRKKEDLRSALVHSVPNKKQILDTQNMLEEKVSFSAPVKKNLITQMNQNIGDKKKLVCANKGRRNKIIPQKSCMCRQRATSEHCPFKGSDTIWINLNEIQNSSSTCESAMHLTTTKSSFSNEKVQKPEGIVEFYDFSSRYHRKSFKEFPHLVERMDQSERPNAIDLAKIEDEEEKEEAKKKVEANNVSQERGMEALRRHKINQDYNNLIAKLEELHRKEKILKAQQRNHPNYLHMTDERLSERLKAKQKLMDSKFESIYYEVISQMPRTEVPRAKPFCRSGGGDFAEVDDGILTQLPSRVLPDRLKTNISATSSGESCEETSVESTMRKSPKKTNRRRQLLLDIDNALKEGRELRKTSCRDRNLTDGDENIEKSSSDQEEAEIPTCDVSPCKEEKTTRCQESQTEDLRIVEMDVADLDLNDLGKTDDSLPVSTSTSYKSPPSVIRSYRLRQFAEYLEGATEVEDDHLIRKGSKYNRKMDKLLHDLFHNNNNNNNNNNKKKKKKKKKPTPWEDSGVGREDHLSQIPIGNLCHNNNGNLLNNNSSYKSGEKGEKSHSSPTLEYFIEKLLNMSRECIADLSISSENISTPNTTDPDIRDVKATESDYSCKVSSKGEDLIRKCRLNRADLLEETIKNWKRILEENSNIPSEVEDVTDCPQSEFVEAEETNTEPVENACVIYSPTLCRRYEEITKKCSERISELSNMLDKVRKDKEKLLSSTSGGSSLSLNKDEKNSEKADEEDEEKKESLEACSDSVEEPRTSLVEGYLNGYSLSKPRKETVSTTAVADSQSMKDLEESLESWPDVMDHLLERKILTSPFKWSDGEYSSELSPVSDSHTKPSSIETVIGNFRKEISRIKPFTLSDSIPLSDSFLKSHTVDNVNKEVFDAPIRKSSSRWPWAEGRQFQEESSVESINQALTNLGLNWAKSFLRKNEESKAINSSSNSEGKCSGDEAGGYP